MNPGIKSTLKHISISEPSHHVCIYANSNPRKMEGGTQKIPTFVSKILQSRKILNTKGFCSNISFPPWCYSDETVLHRIVHVIKCHTCVHIKIWILSASGLLVRMYNNMPNYKRYGGIRTETISFTLRMSLNRRKRNAIMTHKTNVEFDCH